jgi:hypothetical protein
MLRFFVILDSRAICRILDSFVGISADTSLAGLAKIKKSSYGLP